jgi:phage terminase large subunit GpA-like protein
MTERPCPVLVVVPAELDARNYVIDVEQIFEASPSLAGKLPSPATAGRASRNTLLFRRGANGASLRLVGATAPRNLRATNARVLLVDECDALLDTAEGDPIAIATMRTATYADRKLVTGGTPLAMETSHIGRLYAQSDQRIWECCCIHCGQFAEVVWPDISWPAGRPELATWTCPSCGGSITEATKRQFVSRGHWRALAPGVVGHAGFRISALASLLPAAAWPKLAAEWETAKNDPGLAKVFHNTTLALPWEEAGNSIDPGGLEARAEPFGLDRLPPEVLCLTGGIDCGDTYLAVCIVGWSREGVAFILSYQVVHGGPADSESWREIDGLLRMGWKHPLGGSLRLDALAIDAGDGGHMADVLGFTSPRLGRRVFATKGMAGLSRLPLVRSKVKGKPLFVAGTDALKARLFAALERQGRIRFSRDLPPEFYEELTSEVRRVRVVAGKPPVFYARKPGARAEGLDSAILAHAAKSGLNFSSAAFSLREDELRAPPTSPPKMPTVIRSSWMERGRGPW